MDIINRWNVCHICLPIAIGLIDFLKNYYFAEVPTRVVVNISTMTVVSAASLGLFDKYAEVSSYATVLYCILVLNYILEGLKSAFFSSVAYGLEFYHNWINPILGFCCLIIICSLSWRVILWMVDVFKAIARVCKAAEAKMNEKKENQEENQVVVQTPKRRGRKPRVTKEQQPQQREESRVRAATIKKPEPDILETLAIFICLLVFIAIMIGVFCFAAYICFGTLVEVLRLIFVFIQFMFFEKELPFDRRLNYERERDFYYEY